jgi:hypothetical protein
LICKLSLGAVVYYLWKQRNVIKHGGAPSTEEHIVESVRWEVRSRILAIGKFRKNQGNLELCFAWNILVLVLER